MVWLKQQESFSGFDASQEFKFLIKASLLEKFFKKYWRVSMKSYTSTVFNHTGESLLNTHDI